MNGKEFLAAEHIHGANNTRAEIAGAKVTVSAYTRRQTMPETDRLNLYWDLIDELGLNGRPMNTSRSSRKALSGLQGTVTS